MTSGFQIVLDNILDTDISVGRQVGIWDLQKNEYYTVNESCYNVIQSFVAANLASQWLLADPAAAKGGLTLGFNKAGTTPGGALVVLGKMTGNSPTTFWGVSGNWDRTNRLPVNLPQRR